MLRIKKKQTKAMMASKERKYHQQLRAFYRKTIPKQTARFDDATLLEIIAHGVDRARSYGVQSHEAITRFVGLSILVNPRFDEDPAVQNLFEQPGLDPDLKVHILADQTAQQMRAK